MNDEVTATPEEPTAAPLACAAPPVPATEAATLEGLEAGAGLAPGEGAITQGDIPGPEAEAQAIQAQWEEQFKAQLAQLEQDLNAKVNAGQLDPKVRDIVLRSESLKLDKDLLTRKGIAQVSYQTFWRFVCSCFEFSPLLAGAKVKAITMGNNYMQDTIDIVFCSEELQPVEEGQIPPYVRMPEVVFNDFQLLMAIHQKDAKLMQQVLRQAGWDVTVQDSRSKIIVPGMVPRGL